MIRLKRGSSSHRYIIGGRVDRGEVSYTLLSLSIFHLSLIILC